MTSRIQLMTTDPNNKSDWNPEDAMKVNVLLVSLGISSEYETSGRIGVRWVIPTDKLTEIVATIRLMGIRVEVLDD